MKLWWIKGPKGDTYSSEYRKGKFEPHFPLPAVPHTIIIINKWGTYIHDTDPYVRYKIYISEDML